MRLTYRGILKSRRLHALIACGGIFLLGGWRDISNIDRVKDTKIWAFAVRAPQTTQFVGRRVTADLILGCVERNYSTGGLDLGSYVRFSQQIAYGSKGEFRFDKGKVEEFRSAGSDNTGYGINISRRYSPLEFAQLISSSSHLRLQTQLATGYEFFDFDIRKAGDVIAKLPCRPR